MHAIGDEIKQLIDILKLKKKVGNPDDIVTEINNGSVPNYNLVPDYLWSKVMI